MNPNTNLFELCRSCMKQLTVLEKMNYDMTIQEMFTACTNIKITQEDNISRQFCYNCVSKIQSSYAFITEAQKTDVTFKNLTSSTMTSVILVPSSVQYMINPPSNCIALSDMNQQLVMNGNKMSMNNSVQQNVSESKVTRQSVGTATENGDINKDVFVNDDFDNETIDTNLIDVDVIDNDEITNVICSNVIASNASDNDVIDNDTSDNDVIINDVIEENITIKEDDFNKEHNSHAKNTIMGGDNLDSESNISHNNNTIQESNKDGTFIEGKNIVKLCSIDKNDNAKIRRSGRNKKVIEYVTQTPAENDVLTYDNQNEYKPGKKLTACPICYKEFNSKKWLNKHKLKHDIHKCQHCSKTFCNASQLSDHVVSHSRERRHVCEVCGKQLKYYKQLIEHKRTHNPEKPFICDICNKSFKKRVVLKCHMRVHEEDKRYLCPTCGAGFSQAGNYKVHLRTHTGAKPYECSECDFRSAATSNMRRHERVHHDSRPYVCDCGKSYVDASALSRHKRTHAGARPYRCPACARAFNDSWKRKEHMMRAHRFKLADIPRMGRDGQSM